VKSSSEVFVKDLDLSSRAHDAIAAALPDLRNPTVRQVIELTTATRLRELPGVGDGTIDELQAAFRSACEVGMLDVRPKVRQAETATAVVEREAPKTSRSRKAR
jgi:hypothetical protein